MTRVQQVRLLRFYLTGEPGGGKWATMATLLQQGYVAEAAKNLCVTAKGKAWCDANHMQVQLKPS